MMNTGKMDNTLVSSYFTLLKSLSPDNKLELIARLSKSMKTTEKAEEVSLEALYGSYVSEQSADELVKELKEARNFNRNRVEF
jgi:hypothetical protein